MTGETLTDEKHPHSPTSPTGTDATLSGDAIIEIAEDDGADTRPSSQRTRESVESAQPQHEEKPTILRRITAPFTSPPDPLDVVETKTRTLEATPNGFPRLAAFQSSEANFSLYRSFSYLHSRILLDLQDEITSLERELDEIDEDDECDDPDRLRSREVDEDRARSEGGRRNRRVVLREIKGKLMEYDEVLIKARQLESFTKPSDRNYRSVRRYHHNTKPLMDAEMDSIRSKEDIVSLHNGREWATFDGGVETVIGRLDRVLQKVCRTTEPPLQKYFRTPELRAKTSSPHIAFYSSTRIDRLVNILITFVIFILLVVPVVTLYRLTSTPNLPSTDSSNATGPASAVNENNRDTFNAVGVLIVFTLLFSAAMSLLTRAARHELFAASAAYCAILVVFIGNFTGPGN
ncbi:hypothetical protein DE146DRAFT_679493 [Phaeosphaeria sp. MPI-PUGE-AT-0046c]|nr:hypothetical protein DE146DRAFT_679493 [Phaeosphaeria sp. MPI-PUGE-AT-0046c]